ncbi:hypothetical protein DNTS_000388 [Danionella cerebrum]|uniref:B30.2/SPRY domain-containing protein n=1 Tax=Danionella cerebrum TaxID=2873325 RepID=A0A553PX12_9TELE|nr:hypothetical protein DNTS_000388 [Danionella translucida]
MDPNTVHQWLTLSERNTAVHYSSTHHSYPDHLHRFDRWCQVLCTNSVIGHCYWEVEYSGKAVYISVSYKSIVQPNGSKRIGVYVDHHGGYLAFYRISDGMNLIHTIQTTFTQSLYPGFGFGSSGSSAKLIYWDDIVDVKDSVVVTRLGDWGSKEEPGRQVSGEIVIPLTRDQALMSIVEPGRQISGEIFSIVSGITWEKLGFKSWLRHEKVGEGEPGSQIHRSVWPEESGE